MIAESVFGFPHWITPWPKEKRMYVFRGRIQIIVWCEKVSRALSRALYNSNIPSFFVMPFAAMECVLPENFHSRSFPFLYFCLFFCLWAYLSRYRNRPPWNVVFKTIHVLRLYVYNRLPVFTILYTCNLEPLVNYAFVLGENFVLLKVTLCSRPRRVAFDGDGNRESIATRFLWVRSGVVASSVWCVEDDGP